MSSPDSRDAGSPEVAQSRAKAFLRNSVLARSLITFAALAAWFWSQSWLGSRSSPTGPIGDLLHQWTAGLNAYFRGLPRAANALLIISSGLIDAVGIFLLSAWLFAGKVRPFLGLATLLVLRQVMQAMCSLPPPPGMIWHYPGFPSLLVTYGVANDFFFSGHTAIAVFGAMEIARLRRTWLTALAVCMVIFEIATVLVLRAHYTMDVFAGALAAVCVAQLFRNW